MKLPYGISDFKTLREQGNLYIDKTRYIERLEGFNSKYMFFVRPRRFGKSLFLSTLENYYDINAKEDFDKLFGDLYIGQNPTPLRNSYMVLHLDFSALNIDTEQTLKKSFNLRLVSNITRFIRKYQKYLTNTSLLEKAINETDDSGAILTYLIDAMEQTSPKMYLIIDEYDYFANDIIAMGEGSLYKEIIRSLGFVRNFYAAVKIGTKTVIDRIFITGTSPISLDNLTSGFNIAANVSTNARLNEMLGFTEDEVRLIADNVDIREDNEGIVKELKNYYEGYLFDIQGQHRVYNPDMVFYFFKEWEDTQHYPERLMDDNIKTDYGRLERLTRNEDNRVMLEKIIREESITTNIITKFSFDRMYDNEYFESLLFYMGLLTIKGEKRGKLELVLPNYVIRTVFWDYFKKSLKELR